MADRVLHRDDRASREGRALRSLLAFSDELNKLYPRMELGQIRVLLCVLQHPGIRAADLMERTGLTKAAVSRAVRILAGGSYTDDGSGQTKQGLDLITRISDPEDARAKFIAPTRRGRHLIEEVAKIIGEGDGKSTG